MLMQKTHPSLLTAMLGFVVLGAFVAAGGAWFLVSDRLKASAESALAEAVATRTQGLVLDFARALHQEWRSARTIAVELSVREQSAVRSSLDLVVGDTSRVSWAGIATVEGRVTVASGGMLEGQDVSSRPWFQRGLEGDFAGDVHDALLLAKLLPTEGGEPRRFLDLATPIRDAAGAVTGVLGLHLDAAWAKRHLQESAQSLEIDAFLVDRGGVIALSSTEQAPETVDLPSFRAAQLGVPTTSRETWPGGASYFTTVIPTFGYEDLPPFGWSVVGRIDESALAQRGKAVTQSIALFLFGLACVLTLLTAAFAFVFIVPLRQLADNAASILCGEAAYPFETRSSSEAAILSAAVARLQSLEMNRDPA
jgi:hypothetical protein